jgi:hypothetical protein
VLDERRAQLSGADRRPATRRSAFLDALHSTAGRGRGRAGMAGKHLSSYL